jgi:hypothetical protein
VHSLEILNYSNLCRFYDIIFVNSNLVAQRGNKLRGKRKMQKLTLTQEVLTQLTDPKNGADIGQTTLPTCPVCSLGSPPNAK